MPNLYSKANSLNGRGEIEKSARADIKQRRWEKKKGIEEDGINVVVHKRKTVRESMDNKDVIYYVITKGVNKKPMTIKVTRKKKGKGREGREEDREDPR